MRRLKDASALLQSNALKEQNAKTIPQNMCIHFATALNLTIEHFCKKWQEWRTYLLQCSWKTQTPSGMYPIGLVKVNFSYIDNTGLTYTYEWLHFGQWHSSITIFIRFNQSISLITFFNITGKMCICFASFTSSNWDNMENM